MPADAGLAVATALGDWRGAALKQLNWAAGFTNAAALAQRAAKKK